LELRIWDTAANPNVRRTKTQTPSPASRPKGTRAREWCRARRRRRKLPPSLWYLPSCPADTISFVLREWAVHM
jgi:hypothetical protein